MPCWPSCSATPSGCSPTRSISHAGFILVGVQAATDRGVSAVVFYLAAYAFMALGSFGILSIVSGHGDRSTGLDDLDGLAP
ncbi:MAG: proton-conducting transporter membrane subunit [Acidimicrobiales bacterium]